MTVSYAIVTKLTLLFPPSEFTMTNEEPLPKKVCLKIFVAPLLPPPQIVMITW